MLSSGYKDGGTITDRCVNQCCPWPYSSVLFPPLFLVSCVEVGLSSPILAGCPCELPFIVIVGVKFSLRDYL